MLKKVIFVSGTSYSGSTMLDMILANDPTGFSCGQVYNLFHPIRPYQVNPLCGCGEPDCPVWSRIHRNGSRNLYASIFGMFPEVNFVIDSSKDPCWVVKQERIARAQGLDVRHVLTWKAPEGLAGSFAKRGRREEFAPAYVNYHRTYNTLVSNWVGVQHEMLVEVPEILALLCSRLDIPMFDAKSEFWRKRHHTMFGNDSAKISLYSRDHPRFESIRRQRTLIDGESNAPVSEHRRIYRKQEHSGFSLDSLSEPLRHELERVASGLRMQSVGISVEPGTAASHSGGLPKASRFACRLHCVRSAMRRTLASVRYRQNFNPESRKL